MVLTTRPTHAGGYSFALDACAYLGNRASTSSG